MPLKRESSGPILHIDLIVWSIMVFNLTTLLLAGDRHLQDLNIWIMLFAWNLILLLSNWFYPFRSLKRSDNIRVTISVMVISVFLWMVYMGLLIGLMFSYSEEYRAKHIPQMFVMGGSAFLLILAVWVGCRKPVVKDNFK